MTSLYDSRKRILVTGGSGFIGSHLIDRLLELSHDVICADNLFTGTKRNGIKYIDVGDSVLV